MGRPIPLLLVAVLSGAGQASGPAARRESRLTVEVVRERSEAPAAFLEDLEPVLTSAVAARGCFREVEAMSAALSGPGDLLLRVAFDAFQDEISFDASIAERSSPGSTPDLRRQQEALVLSGFLAELRLPGPNGAVVRSQHYRRRVSYRPVFDEDPRSTTLDQMAEAVARTVRNFACDGSEKRFGRELARAGADGKAAPAPTPP